MILSIEAVFGYGLALVLVSLMAIITLYGRKHARWSNGERASGASIDAASDRPRGSDQGG